MCGYRSDFRCAPLLLVFLMITLLTACTQPGPLPTAPTLSSDPVVRWIQQNAVRLRTSNPGGSDADLASFKQIVGQASLVGLGEETHGTHEFITMKARLVEFLISNMGFTTLVMENNWGESQLLDAYISGGSGDLTNIMSQTLFGSWQTQEYKSLFAWMRTYNGNPAHTTKIHFLGMDIQGLSQSDFTTVENYIQQVDPQHSASVQNLYAPILSKSVTSSYGSYSLLDASTKQQYQNQAQQVYDLLQADQQSDIAHSSAQSFALALQTAHIIVQFTTYANVTTREEANAHFLQRDTFMAENVEWIYDHAVGAHPKMIVWAHDEHIANDTTYGTADGRNMGGELRARYSQSYLPIGTSLYQGTFRTYSSYPSNRIQTISSALSDTYNYTLGQAGLSLYMLDLRKVPPGPVDTWVRGRSPFLLYGLGGQNLTSSVLLSAWFDVIVHVQNTTPSEYLL